MASITNLVFHKPNTATFDGTTLIFGMSEPWYRTLPVSCITDLKVKVDGRDIPREDIRIEIEGVTRRIEDCADAWDYNWFIQDLAMVHVKNVSVGETAQISVHLVTRIPYIMVSPTNALPHHAMQTETFKVVAA